MSTEFDNGLRSWKEVADIWNERERDNLKPDTAKEIGRQAILKLRNLMESRGDRLEEMVDL